MPKIKHLRQSDALSPVEVAQPEDGTRPTNSGIDEALRRLVRLLGRQAAREAAALHATDRTAERAP